ncbi:Peptidase A1 [Corchorus capsularis]|uniref:Peptidase A1 n=1 Tax=Corchorus capsularis TaxID=210143 RepID=A0A1R3IDK2_COCAP|nr:Peptidase A1 [Corchorus capsularis]
MSLALHFILLTLFQFHFAFANTSNPLGLTIRAVIDDSPESPLYKIEKLTIAERVERLVNITNARINYLDSILDDQNPKFSNNFLIKIYRESLMYAVEFKIGSRQHQVKLLLDTGGGLIWTQCQPCRTCFNQTLPMYDPRLSSTYSRLPCSHPLCQGTGAIYQCVSGSYCSYDIQYGSGTSIKGVASNEVFEFPMADGSTQRLWGGIFGCSYEITKFPGQGYAISGIFGLSKSPDSMSSQYSDLIQSRFSYCLVPYSSALPRPLVLRFGEDIPQPPRLQTTLFMQVPSRPYYYYLQLLDITVANHRIGFHPNTFEIRPNGDGGYFYRLGSFIHFY